MWHTKESLVIWVSKMRVQKTVLIAAAFALSTIGCGTNPEKSRKPPVAQDGLQRVEQRTLDMASLKQTLLKVAGDDLPPEKVFPALPKSILLYTDKPGTLAGYYAAGNASRWNSAFEKWCDAHDGKMKTSATSAAVRYSEVTSDQNPALRVVTSNSVLVCFGQEEGKERYNQSPPLAELTLFHVMKPIENATMQRPGYLVVQDRGEIVASRDTYRAAREAKAVSEQASQQKAEAEWRAAKQQWEQLSRNSREGLKPGDAMVVVVSNDRQNWPYRVLVVEVRSPLSQIQLSGKIQWVKIENLNALDIPPLLFCSSSGGQGRLDCLKAIQNR